MSIHTKRLSNMTDFYKIFSMKRQNTFVVDYSTRGQRLYSKRPF